MTAVGPHMVTDFRPWVATLDGTEDDMPYKRKAIGGMVKEGVAKELRAETTKKEIQGLVRQAVAHELQAFSKDPS